MNKITFISYQSAESKEENGLGGMGGFFDDGMRWKDYLEIWKPEVHELLEDLRKAIVESGLKCTGAEHQSGALAVPLFPDGKVATYSYRAWGDLMAAVWSEEENKDYSYMSFYC